MSEKGKGNSQMNIEFIRHLRVKTLHSEQEILPQRHRREARRENKNIKNSVPLCLCGSILIWPKVARPG